MTESIDPIDILTAGLAEHWRQRYVIGWTLKHDLDHTPEQWTGLIAKYAALGHWGTVIALAVSARQATVINGQ